MTELEASVAEVASTLEELSVPYMLIGALAVAAWGEARATLDVDLSVWVKPEDFAATVGALCSRLKALPADPLGFAGQTRCCRCCRPLAFGSIWSSRLCRWSAT